MMRIIPANGSMAQDTGEENNYGVTDLSMKDILNQIWLMEKED